MQLILLGNQDNSHIFFPQSADRENRSTSLFQHLAEHPDDNIVLLYQNGFLHGVHQSVVADDDVFCLNSYDEWIQDTIVTHGGDGVYSDMRG